jgi:lipopolysaccharide export system protein LptA
MTPNPWERRPRREQSAQGAPPTEVPFLTGGARRLGPVKIGLALVCALAAGPAAALSTDRTQPVEIEADRAELDDAQGVTRYEGQVIVIQGTLKITGDRVVLYYDQERQVTRAEAFGNPATYEQLPDGQQEPVRARALRMEYQVREGVIDLYQEAEVTQRGDRLAGDRVTYDTANSQVRAMRAGGGDDRVRVILTPRTKEGQGPNAAQGPKEAQGGARR